jgi:hypothetical protein
MKIAVQTERADKYEIKQLFYLKWQDLFISEKPYEVFMDVPGGLPTSNFEVQPAPEQNIYNLRGYESEFNLDTHAFSVRSSPLGVAKFDKKTVEQEYLPEVEKLLRREVDDATQNLFFDWRV